MRNSLRSYPLPKSKAEYEQLMAEGNLRFKVCCFCNESHLDKTHTRLGWAETQISGACEECFDNLFKEQE